MLRLRAPAFLAAAAVALLAGFEPPVMPCHAKLPATVGSCHCAWQGMTGGSCGCHTHTVDGNVDMSMPTGAELTGDELRDPSYAKDFKQRSPCHCTDPVYVGLHPGDHTPQKFHAGLFKAYEGQAKGEEQKADAIIEKEEAAAKEEGGPSAAATAKEETAGKEETATAAKRRFLEQAPSDKGHWREHKAAAVARKAAKGKDGEVVQVQELVETPSAATDMLLTAGEMPSDHGHWREHKAAAEARKQEAKGEKEAATHTEAELVESEPHVESELVEGLDQDGADALNLAAEKAEKEGDFDYIKYVPAKYAKYIPAKAKEQVEANKKTVCGMCKKDSTCKMCTHGCGSMQEAEEGKKDEKVKVATSSKAEEKYEKEDNGVRDALPPPGDDLSPGQMLIVDYNK